MENCVKCGECKCGDRVVVTTTTHTIFCRCAFRPGRVRAHPNEAPEMPHPHPLPKRFKQHQPAHCPRDPSLKPFGAIQQPVAPAVPVASQKEKLKLLWEDSTHVASGYCDYCSEGFMGAVPIRHMKSKPHKEKMRASLATAPIPHVRH